MKRRAIIVNKKALELDISTKAFKMLSILVLYSDEKGRCYPSMETIEKKYHLPKSRIIRAIKELEDQHVIMVYRRKKGTGKIDSNEYIIAPQYLAETIRKSKQIEIFDYDWLNDTDKMGGIK